MSVAWIRGQRQVIDYRGGNLLVSAAAGSGKTAVLVERIVEMITEKNHPVDIDHLLIMTFTNAAAAEMRERIRDAIDKRREENPTDKHLELQSILVPRAQITTIDSFCLGLIREYYNYLDMDPAFRIGDQGELSLLQGDVMKQLLEDWYASGDPAFLHFAETYASGKSDSGLEDVIFQVWRFSQSHPWPNEWMRQCRKELEETSAKEAEESPWMRFLMDDIHMQAEEMRRHLLVCARVCEEDGGPSVYRDTILEDADMVGKLAEAEDYERFFELLNRSSFGKLPPVRSKEVSPEKKSFVTSFRDRVKKIVKGWQENYGRQSLEMVIDTLAETRETTELLLKLADEFSSRFQEAKKERNLVDFNDLEHFALEVLWETKDGKRVPSAAAYEVGSRFEEIMVDEYQDSNLVQETLIKAISKEKEGRPNVFMVGDVKQSIYRFRLARPDLFLEKYESYSEGEGAYQKVELRQNFRSRASVLHSVNAVFYQIMRKNLGGIQYTEETALYSGAEFEPPREGAESRTDTGTELLVVPTGSQVLEGLEEDAADYTERELEARMIAAKIRSLTDKENGLFVWDKKQGSYRTAALGDIVILLRSVTGWAEVLVSVLMNAGIPAAAQTQTGYFDTVEVETILSLLAIVDNPFQDIPLACVLKSPIIGMTEEQLAWLMANYKQYSGKNKYGDRGLYGAVRFWLSGEDDSQIREEKPDITEKLEKLEEMLQEYRLLATWLPIHELLYQIYQKSGYYDYVSAMPAGRTRQANLDMLAEKASAYENTSYKGLFHFIRYIEKLKKFETDFGEASAFGENSDVVRIMSIHKSKGLEFPVVILAGMGKRFNKQDLINKILIDPDLGLASDYLDLERRVKVPTLKKQALKRRMDMETLGEELRILYVAMTRAKEKLILTASEKSLDKKLEKWGTAGEEKKAGIPSAVLSGASSYLDWILMALPGAGGRITMKEVPASDLVGEEVLRQIDRKTSKEDLLGLDCTRTYDQEFQKLLRKQLSYKYPFQADMDLYAMLSVSEIKRRRQLLEMEDKIREGDTGAAPKWTELEDLSQPSGSEPSSGSIRTSGRRIGGAALGTCIHRILELLPFEKSSEDGNREETMAFLLQSIKDMEERGTIQKEEADSIELSQLAAFLQSPLGRRMIRAQKEGRLHREQQFMVGIPAKDMEIAQSEELVLVQGMIDAWIEEEDGLVLIDYKSDRTGRNGEQQLIRRYRIQLEYYKRSLEQITGRQVKEAVIYSFHLGKEIRL